MLDGTYKSEMDRVWDRLAVVLVRLGLTPNQVTLAGLVLVALACGYYLATRDGLGFGLLLALSLAGDALDGAVARLTDSASHYGAYLDAVVDRYQEILVLGTIARVQGCWGLAYLAITGSLLISYTKARVAMEIPVENGAWPDLLERTERVILIVAALVVDGLLPGHGLLWWGLVALAALSHATALQRFFRARGRLRAAALKEAAPPPEGGP